MGCRGLLWSTVILGYGFIMGYRGLLQGTEGSYKKGYYGIQRVIWNSEGYDGAQRVIMG